MKTAGRNVLPRLLTINVVVIALIVLGALVPTGHMARPAASIIQRVPGAGQVRPLAHGDPDRNASSSSLFGDQSYFERAYPRSTIPFGAYRRGFRQAQSMRLYQTAGWQEVGPFAAPNNSQANPSTGARAADSGRAMAIAVDPSTCSSTDCGTIYVGGGGGLWKTTDAGQTWAPLTDAMPNVSAGVITLDPQNPNIVYVGTGDPGQGSGARAGIGILRSTDGGQTWTLLGSDQFADRAVSAIVIDPRTAGSTGATLYVTSTSATRGGSTTQGDSSDSPHNPPTGFFFSTDGGQTWTRSTPGDRLQSESLVMDPSNPNVLYAGFDYWGVAKSTDDGQTWTPITNGLPQQIFSNIQVAISASNPQVLYAAYDQSDTPSGPEGIYRTTDGGASWVQLRNAPNACGDQCFGNMVLAVDPTNPDVVYAGGSGNYGYLFGEDPACQTLYPLPAQCNATWMRSLDGGNTWGDIVENGNGGPVHPDAHAIVIAPTQPNVVYVGTDGGLFHSADAGQTWNDLNRGLRNFMVVGLAAGPTGTIYIGLQDNGTLASTGQPVWTTIATGDGGATAVDPKNPKLVYHTYYGAQLARNENGGASEREISINPFHRDYDDLHRGQFYEPFALAPSNGSVIYFGTYRIWRSTMRGGKDGNNDGVAYNDSKDKTDWVPISFDLNCPSKPGAATATCSDKNNPQAGVSAIAVSPVNPNVVVASTATGRLWLTKNALAKVKTDASCDPRTNPHLVANCNFVSGVQWTRIDNGLPQRFPTSLKFAPGSSTRLYVTYSGFDESTPGKSGHVFGSNDQGRSWSNIGGSGDSALPNLPFSDIVINPRNGHLYASADYGIYISTDNGGTWQRLDQGVPGVNIYQMQFNPADGSLLAGSYGRGVWKTSAP